MNESNITKVITFKDLWAIFVRCWWLMALAAVLVAGSLKVFDIVTFVPEYKSVATLYILRQKENAPSTSGDATNDFSLALKVVNDCDYLLKSHAVVDQVIDDLSIDLTYEELRSAISTSNPEDTRILEVSVRASSPERAQTIVNRLCEVGQEKITDAMGFEQVNLYEYGTFDGDPCNRTGLMNYLMIAVVVAILIYVIYLLVFLFDDRLRGEEDIERYLGLSILGDIPNSADTGKRRYGYQYAYKAYKPNPSKKRKDS